MDDFRSKSCGHLETHYNVGPTSLAVVNGMQDLRCYSASSSYAFPIPPPRTNNDVSSKGKQTKKGSGSKRWSGLGDAEMKRKKRVASYKVYTVEGKLKESLSKSFRWLKNTCDQLVYGR